VTAPPVERLLHAPLLALVQAYGPPQSARTGDDGSHVVFADGSARIDAIVDDAGDVHAVDLAFPAGTHYALGLDDGAAHPLVFGSTTSLAARDALAADAETEGGDFRVFKRDAASDAVLVFDAATHTLSHVVVGDRATLLRLGYVRSPIPATPVFPFRAPVLQHSALAAGNGARATVLQLDVDRLGAVQRVRVVVPSGDAAFDEAAVRAARADVYAPATLSGRPIGAGVLREVRH
jgi:TonB family protein